jgi:hypothetical protein
MASPGWGRYRWSAQPKASRLSATSHSSDDNQLDESHMSVSVANAPGKTVQAAPGLVLGAIGVVFGDIGTSPLYTLRECLKAAGGVTQPNVFGIVSLILWSILVVVTLKYAAATSDFSARYPTLTAL